MEIRESTDGVLVTLAVQPSARKRALRRDRNGRIKLMVPEPPEDGRANRAFVELLAEILGVRKSEIALVTGAVARMKTFRVERCSADEVRARLESATCQRDL